MRFREASSHHLGGGKEERRGELMHWPAADAGSGWLSERVEAFFSGWWKKGKGEMYAHFSIHLLLLLLPNLTQPNPLMYGLSFPGDK